MFACCCVHYAYPSTEECSARRHAVMPGAWMNDLYMQPPRQLLVSLAVLGITVHSVLWTFSVFFQKLPILPHCCSSFLLGNDILVWDSVRVYACELAKHEGFSAQARRAHSDSSGGLCGAVAGFGRGGWVRSWRLTFGIPKIMLGLHPPLSLSNITGPNPLNLTWLPTGAEVGMS